MTYSSPKISVIIPVYNVERYLQRCLDSVINQTFKDIEILCVNDGSTDNSLTILNEYAQKDTRIKILNKVNGGLSSARNYGLDNAAGEYCYFLDSDDWIEVGTIQILHNIMLDNDVDCVVHNAQNIPESQTEEKIAIGCQAWFDSRSKVDGIYEIPLNINKEIACVAWNKLYKMDIINKFHCRFPEGLINEDEAFIWIYMIHCNTYYYVDKKFYNYLRRSSSIMGQKDNDIKALDILKIQKIIFETVKKYKNINDYKDVLTENYCEIVNDLIRCLPKKYHKEALLIIKDYISNANDAKKIKKTYNKLKFRPLKLFIEGIFSLKNVQNVNSAWKQVAICGFKIKFKNKRKTEQLLKQKLDITINCITKTQVIKNRIVFNNFNGDGYGCNPKYIAEEILKQNLPYELIWLVKYVAKNKCQFPPNIKLVEYTTQNAIKEFASAEVWISNQRMSRLYENGLFKKDNQYYIQTWHGSLGIKKVEASIEDVLSPDYVKYAKEDSKYIDYMLSNSFYDDRMFNDFWYNGKILRTGHPRCDIFFSKDEDKSNITNKVKESLGIDKNKQVLLYIPTFRDGWELDAYDIDINKILQTTKNKFGGEWVFAIRLHPNLSQKAQSYFEYGENIINATLYSDVLELLLSSDIVITDYSSCIFDFIFTKKPAFIYASDLDKYNNDRGFYYPLENTPFPIATTNKQLVHNVANFDYKEYLTNVDKFLKEKACVEDGHSSERTVELIKSIMGCK